MSSALYGGGGLIWHYLDAGILGYYFRMSSAPYGGVIWHYLDAGILGYYFRMSSAPYGGGNLALFRRGHFRILFSNVLCPLRGGGLIWHYLDAGILGYYFRMSSAPYGGVIWHYLDAGVLGYYFRMSSPPYWGVNLALFRRGHFRILFSNVLCPLRGGGG